MLSSSRKNYQPLRQDRVLLDFTCSFRAPAKLLEAAIDDFKQNIEALSWLACTGISKFSCEGKKIDGIIIFTWTGNTKAHIEQLQPELRQRVEKVFKFYFEAFLQNCDINNTMY
jgi:hypothetical protein